MAAEQNNTYAQKYSLDEALPLFLEMLEYSLSDECLCVQDAFLHIKMPSSTFHYLIDKYKVLEDIKKDINANVISKVNKGALKGDFQPTASIWRMKQLGERDKTEVTQTNIDATPLTPEEIQKAQEDIDNSI